MLSLLNLVYATLALVHAGDLKTVDVIALRPTQFAVGERVVREKAENLSGKSEKKLAKYLDEHPAPVVVGPGGAMFITDHHHLARALWEMGRTKMKAAVIADFAALDGAEFWRRMRDRHWVYLKDATGKDREPTDLPRDVRAMSDDPYRSLAGEARDAGAFGKSEIPFAEFQWAEFFRARIKIASGDGGFDRALERAIELAHSPEAKHLPGWLPNRH